MTHSAGGRSHRRDGHSPRRPFPVRHLTLLLVLSLAATASLASVARAAAPLRTSGVVLSTSLDRHALRVAEGSRVVGLSFRGSLPVVGSAVRFAGGGRAALHLVVLGHVDHVLVSGTVVRDGDGLALRLGDGSLLALPKARHPRLGSAAPGVGGLPARRPRG